jgi:hypothetical protein
MLGARCRPRRPLGVETESCALHLRQPGPAERAEEGTVDSGELTCPMMKRLRRMTVATRATYQEAEAKLRAEADIASQVVDAVIEKTSIEPA